MRCNLCRCWVSCFNPTSEAEIVKEGLEVLAEEAEDESGDGEEGEGIKGVEHEGGSPEVSGQSWYHDFNGLIFGWVVQFFRGQLFRFSGEDGLDAGKVFVHSQDIGLDET